MVNDRKKPITKCEGIFLLVGSVLVLGGLALVLSQFALKATKRGIENDLVLRPNSSVLDTWTHPTVPSYLKFYVFNVTNGDAIMRGEKPALEEHGPYTYRMMSPRFNITFYPNDTVSFRNNYTLHFEPNLSSGSENDVLLHINIPLVNLGQKIGGYPGGKMLKFFKIPDNFLRLVGNENVIVAHTVRQIVFGYDEPMLTAASNVMSLLGRNIDPVFGPFHGFNNSDDGVFLVKTGKKNFEEFNVIERWNGETRLSYWSNTYANMLNGTDGSFLKPDVHRDESRYLYLPQMRRSLKLEYEEESCVKGVDTLRYHFAQNLLENASVCPDNIGFCVPEDNCFDSGLLNVGAYGEEKAPIVLSLPHFYQGSERLKESVAGLVPNKTLHDSVFHVEPMTGAVMLGQRRLQINVHVTHREYFNNLGNISPVFFPYMWVSGETTVDDSAARKLRMAVTMVAFASYVGYIPIAIGIIMLAATLWRRCRRLKTEIVSDEQPLIGDGERVDDVRGDAADVDDVRGDAAGVDDVRGDAAGVDGVRGDAASVDDDVDDVSGDAADDDVSGYAADVDDVSGYAAGVDDGSGDTTAGVDDGSGDTTAGVDDGSGDAAGDDVSGDAAGVDDVRGYAADVDDRLEDSGGYDDT